MKISIVYDNTAFKADLRPDWGFSCVVQQEDGYTILFDTGANGELLLANMEKLAIAPGSVDDVFISHAHFDHIGGLKMFLDVNPDVRVYCPQSLSGVQGAKEVIAVGEAPVQIHETIFSTGEIDQVEQSMAVTTPKGVVLVVGCSHPKMANILAAASKAGQVYAIIGGMHGFNDFGLFKDMGCICPTHCTQYIDRIRSLYPGAYISGGAGRTIEL